MKRINEFRSTNKFCVTSSFTFDAIAQLHAAFGDNLITVAHDPDIHGRHEYTVRVTRFNGQDGIIDLYVKVNWEGIAYLKQEGVQWLKDADGFGVELNPLPGAAAAALKATADRRFAIKKGNIEGNGLVVKAPAGDEYDDAGDLRDPIRINRGLSDERFA